MVGAGAVRLTTPTEQNHGLAAAATAQPGLALSEVGPDAAAVAEDATVGNPTLSGQIRTR